MYEVLVEISGTHSSCILEPSCQRAGVCTLPGEGTQAISCVTQDLANSQLPVFSIIFCCTPFDF